MANDTINGAYVNPYLNTYGRGLNLYQVSNGTWQTATLKTADTTDLQSSSPPSNIWDSVNRKVRAYSSFDPDQNSNVRILANSTSAPTEVWKIPNPITAGDISQVNVLINNNNDRYYVILGGATLNERASNIDLSTITAYLLPPNSTVTINASLGINYLIPIPSINDIKNDIRALISRIEQAIVNDNIVDIFSNMNSTQSIRSRLTSNLTLDIESLITRLQIFPIPDGIITIDDSINYASDTLSNIPITQINIHNCYNQTMFIRQRPCKGTAGQNIGIIWANSSIRIQLYDEYQMYLQSGNGMVVSDILKYPKACYRYCCRRNSRSRQPRIYFKRDQTLSIESCNGFPFTSSTCGQNMSSPVQIYSRPDNENWWAEWWWTVVFGVIILILIVILLIYVGREPRSIELHDTMSIPERVN